MAIDLKQLKANCAASDVAPVSNEEAKLIIDIENYIDNEITNKYSSDNTGIWIPSDIVNFDYNPIVKKHTCGLTTNRKKFLREQLLKPYIEYGWEIVNHNDMDTIGDYVIFKGK